VIRAWIILLSLTLTCCSGTNRTGAAYDVIGRIPNAATRIEHEARIRDAQAAFKAAMPVATRQQLAALAAFQVAAEAEPYSPQPYPSRRFLACRAEVWRAISGSRDLMEMDKVANGDCARYAQPGR
jgi:hypothetical protein